MRFGFKKILLTICIGGALWIAFTPTDAYHAALWADFDDTRIP